MASTTIVDSGMRGTLGGLFNTSESLGRFLGPVGFATMFAWSISPSSYDWVEHHFVFIVAALSTALYAVLAWGTLTHENMVSPSERRVSTEVSDLCENSVEKRKTVGSFHPVAGSEKTSCLV